jgi:hypothetical protein
VIEFSPSYPELELLKKSVDLAEQHRRHIVSLSELAPHKDVSALTQLGQDWQNAGLGKMIEINAEGGRFVEFSLNRTAVSVVSELRRESLFGRLRSINRSDWIALGALFVSCVALFK